MANGRTEPNREPLKAAPVPYPQRVASGTKSGKKQAIGELDLGELDLGELDLIGRIRERAARNRHSQLRLGIGDDCALLRPRAGEELAVTTDLSIAGRHFQLAWHPPQAVGHRTLARGLSDLAAMGARPVAAFLSLGLPRELVRTRASSVSWIDAFLDGFMALADATGTPLAGGDLAESPLFAADIVLIGAVRRGRALLRSGARPGDLLYVTGALGGAAAGLARLQREADTKRHPSGAKAPASLAAGFGTTEVVLFQKGSFREAAEAVEVSLAPHLWPQPRLAQGQWLVRHKAASAALDISDGLSTDLAHLCEESGVAAEVDATSLPIHAGATLEQALHGGEDYELLFTASPKTRLPRKIAGVAVTQIGRIVRRNARRPQIALLTSKGREPLTPKGWQHFSAERSE